MALIDDIISYWKLDEFSDGSSAVTRIDSHGSNDLTDNNTVPSATGKIDLGADIERDNSEWLSRADNSSLEPANLSVSCWIKLESQPSSDWGVVVKNHNVSTWTDPYMSYGLRIFPASSNRRLQFWSGGSDNSFDTLDSGTNLSLDTWYFVVITYDGANKKIYLNGSENATKTYSKTLGYSTGNFYIGRTNNGEYYDGVIDEVGLWSRALSPEEITELYNSGAGLAYPFSDAGPANLKTYNTNVKANIKTIDTNVIANVKSLNTNV